MTTTTNGHTMYDRIHPTSTLPPCDECDRPAPALHPDTGRPVCLAHHPQVTK